MKNPVTIALLPIVALIILLVVADSKISCPGPDRVWMAVCKAAVIGMFLFILALLVWFHNRGIRNLIKGKFDK